MKYSKIVKDGYQYRNSFLISIAFSVLLFVLLSCFGVGIKGTEAYFSGIEPDLTYDFVITYLSNYPVDIDDDITFVGNSSDEYTVIDNTFFDVPSGYKFVGWNTKEDGSGIVYNVGSVVSIDSNLYLYAIWDKITDIDNNGDERQDDDKEDNNTNNENNNGDNINSSGNGSGQSNGGSSGSGSSNGGNSGSGTSNGNVNSGNVSGNASNNSGNSNNSKNPVINNDDKEDDIEVVLPEIYEFIFINGENIYASTSCDVLENRTCKIVYPSNNPIKIGYKFKGWSLSNLCIDDDIITSDIDVDGNRTYYACYELDENYDKSDNKWIYLVIGVWIIALIMIYFSIRKFRKNDEND